MSYGYAPAPLAPPPFRQESWIARNWKWFVPTVALGIILLAVLVIGGVFSLVFAIMKSSEPYQHAVDVAVHDARATGQLGTPVTPGWFATGNINVSGAAGYADLSIPLNGKLRHGTVYLRARKSAGIWRYQRLELEVDGAPERINLLASPPPEKEK
jgi:cytochrome oxidase complex assembly protein 1